MLSSACSATLCHSDVWEWVPVLLQCTACKEQRLTRNIILGLRSNPRAYSLALVWHCFPILPDSRHRTNEHYTHCTPLQSYNCRLSHNKIWIKPKLKYLYSEWDNDLTDSRPFNNCLLVMRYHLCSESHITNWVKQI